MTNKELAELVLKAKAFDNLMKLCDGKEECVKAYNSIVETPIAAFVPSDSDPVNTTMETVRVYIYEWRIRVKNNTDLRQVLLDEAAGKKTKL